MNSSNIREIPLVDNLPSTRKPTAIKTVPIVEDEVSCICFFFFLSLTHNLPMQFRKRTPRMFDNLKVSVTHL